MLLPYCNHRLDTMKLDLERAHCKGFQSFAYRTSYIVGYLVDIWFAKTKSHPLLMTFG